MKNTVSLLLLALVTFFALTSEWWVGVAIAAVVVYTAVIFIDAFLFKSDVLIDSNQPVIISALMQLSLLLILPFIDVEFEVSTPTAIAFCAGVLNMLGFWLYFKAVKIDQDAVVISIMMNLLIALVPLMAFFTIGESLRPIHYVGILLIFLGAMVATYQKAKADKRVALLMLGSIVLLAASMVALKESLNILYDAHLTTSMYWSAMIPRALGCGSVGILFYLIAIREESSRLSLHRVIGTYWLLFLIIELLEVGGDMLTSLAMLDGDVSIIAAMDGLMGIIGIGIAAMLVIILKHFKTQQKLLAVAQELYREQSEHYHLKLIGMALIIVGAYLAT